MTTKAKRRSTTLPTATTIAAMQRWRFSENHRVKLAESTTASFQAEAEVTGAVDDDKQESAWRLHFEQCSLDPADDDPEYNERLRNSFRGKLTHYWEEKVTGEWRLKSDAFNISGTVDELRAFFAGVTSVRDQMRAAGFDV